MKTQFSQMIDLDRSLFQKINLDWTNSIFDWLFPAITDLHRDLRAIFVVLILLGFWIFRQRERAVRWLVLTVLCVGLSDTITYRLIKANVGRDRPSATNVGAQLRTLEHSGASFPSNHAANIFAAATMLGSALPRLSPAFFIIAFLVAYSRVYVGVHFPLDITVGAVIGVLIAVATRKLLGAWAEEPTLLKLFKKKNRDEE